MARRTGSESVADTGLERVWQVADAQVASGRIPGYVGAVRIGGRVESGGRADRRRARTARRCGRTRCSASPRSPSRSAARSRSASSRTACSPSTTRSRVVAGGGEPRVLAAPDAPLDRTGGAAADHGPAPADADVRLGRGARGHAAPAAMIERHVYPGPAHASDVGRRVRRAGRRPAARLQPGEGWLYDTGIDVLGVVLARATGKPLSELLAERITGPLGHGVHDFGPSDVDRLATAYRPGPRARGARPAGRRSSRARRSSRS